MEVSPSITDLSDLSVVEKALVLSMRELEKTKGIDAPSAAVDRQMKEVAAFASALTHLSVDAAKESDPEVLKRITVITDYIGAMLWEWHLRCSTPEMLQKMEELGRAAAEIGEGLFPLDDETHPINRLKREA